MRINRLLSFSSKASNLLAATSKSFRYFASDAASKPSTKEDKGDADDGHKAEKSESSGGWLSRLLLRKIETGHVSHESVLSQTDAVYELQFDAVKPEYMDEYQEEFGQFAKMLSAAGSGGSLIGSWTVEIGELDEAVHLWQFPNGYTQMTEHKSFLCKEKDFADIIEKRKQFLRSSKNQVMSAFSYWPELKGRDGGNIYELRSYVLKPGTMIEWGINWARAIKYRNEDNEAVGGFFSQIGDQNFVHHLWVYKSLQDRLESRESAWTNPGWDKCVAHTVPLVRHMTSRILIPAHFSKLQ